MSPSKWILAFGAIIEAMLLGLFLDRNVDSTEIVISGSEQQLAREIMEGAQYGLPQIIGAYQGQIVSRKGYTLSYNESRRIPDWVAYELTYQETLGQVPRETGFYPDPVVRGLQATIDDYKYSGWDRGHMAPAGDMKWSESAMLESCYFTNICPQNPELNGGKWRTLEEKCRDLTLDYSSIQIVCGPIVKEAKWGSIGDNHVLIPDAFFKVLLIRKKDGYEGIGFYFENQPAKGALRNYTCSIDEIEILTGMDFFSSLEDVTEGKVESVVELSYWRI